MPVRRRSEPRSGRYSAILWAAVETKEKTLVGGRTVTEDLAAAGRGVVIGVLVVRNSAGDSLGVK